MKNTVITILLKVGNPLASHSPYSNQITFTMGVVMGVAFSISLLLFVVLHAVLIVRGQTTLECGSLRDFPYNLGRTRNIQAVFGTSWFWCWLPVPGPCHGMSFELNHEVYGRARHSEDSFYDEENDGAGDIEANRVMLSMYSEDDEGEDEGEEDEEDEEDEEEDELEAL